MIPLAEFTLGAALLTVLEIFLFMAWIWVLITVIGDLFSDHTVSGWGKAAWTFALILVPFFGVFLYLIVRGGSMHERGAKRQADAQQQLDAYIRQAAAGSSADELVKLAGLRDQGALSDAEFEQAKQKLLSGNAAVTG
ncbi:MAG TPA: SHOCT domain-containing protein [Solirubrobacterales bacterium]|nr:SHOCT domain-containing protein [Solirubrobacterales bacterium]